MQTHGCLRLLAVVTGFGLASLAAQAQTAPVQGKLISATTQISGISTVVTVYTTPSSGHFILTQFCTGGFGTLSGKTFGSIASCPGSLGPGANPPPCISFYPGFPLPTHEKIHCTGAGFCSIAGVIEP
jgi:hypothetical protein